MHNNLKGIRALFFDAGGTLIHLDSPYICALLRDQFGIEAAIDQFPHAQSLAMQRVAQLVSEGNGSTEQLKDQFYGVLLPRIGVPQEKLPAATECLLKLAKAEMLWRRTEEATPAVLARLRERGLRLAVVSNSDGRIENAFAQAGLTEYFDFFIDSFLVGVEKPDPRIFHLALEKAGVSAPEAAYVGDLYAVDVLGARQAGLLPVLYDPYRLSPDDDCVRIGSLGDLLLLTDGGQV